MTTDLSPARPLPPWERLLDRLSAIAEDGVVVAFSGGLDSSVLLDAGVAALGPERVVAFTAVSPSLAESELGDARRIAKEVGAHLVEAETHELDDPGYVANAGDRCYFCKRELFSVVRRAAESLGLARVAYGYHVDDDADVRPGLRAALEAGALRPLYDAGLRKRDLREIAAARGRSFAAKASGACLASRIPMGTPVTPSRLGRVETLEAWLRGRGYAQVRARLDRDDAVRIETAPGDVARLAGELAGGAGREELLALARSVGVESVTVDPSGYRRPGES